jgi:Tol biopolymer transport system component
MKLITLKILKTLSVVVLLSLSAVPALAQTENGPLVFSKYYGQSIETFDPITRRMGDIGVNAYGSSPDVTPDGKTAVYVAGTEIYSIPMYKSSAVPTQLTTTGPPNSDKQSPTVSPDGKTVYFQYDSAPDGSGIYSVPIGGGDITLVIQDNADHYGLQITPDGENFLYRDALGSMYVKR